jgi:5-methylcytosine-specific restriction endonuclease McrA
MLPMSRDWRSEEAAEYRRLYATKAWAILRKQVLLRDAYRCQHKGCGAMLKVGRKHPRSAVVHHIKPHKGDLKMFHEIDNLQAVCWTCHSGSIQSIEAKGFDATIGADGWPVDPKHPGAR